MLTLDHLYKMQQNFGSIAFREKRPNVFKVILPIYYEDGDMYDIFVEESPFDSSKIRICDYGITLMKLSYTFDLDTPHKNEIFNDIISQNRCQFDNGNIYIDVFPAQLECGIYQLAQVISKVSNMEIISRESLKSYFYEFLDSFVFEDLAKHYSVTKSTSPGNNKDCVVDYEIASQKPIYLFGVNDNNKASKVVISCLNFMQENISFRSLIVHENFEKLSGFNQKQITNVSDKQYTSFDEFRNNGLTYITRELSA
ncbi:MAG: DUF1828 domain-containing protein [Clostridia bacterium]|nr:DUF1828 domain-containing protein [Clostridia bacterium]